MVTPEQQIKHLETLLADLRRRYNSGDRSVEAQLRATSAKLEQLKLEAGYKKEQPTTVAAIAKTVVRRLTRRCCG